MRLAGKYNLTISAYLADGNCAISVQRIASKLGVLVTRYYDRAAVRQSLDRIKMKYIQYLSFAFFILFLQGCSESSSSSAEVEVGVVGTPETIYPARYEFGPITELDITSYRWSFSDGSAQSGERVVHVFQSPGIHQVRVEYTTASGRIGSTTREVRVGSGSVTGTISAALNTLVDVDTRDPAEPEGSNDDFGNAQQLSSQGRLAGVVDGMDPVDVYQVNLQKDQVISLSISPKGAVGIVQARTLVEIFTKDDLGTAVVTMNVLSSGSWSYVVPQQDTYFIKLTAVNPISRVDDITFADGTKGTLTRHAHGNYLLSLEEAAAAAEFAEGEVLVQYKENREYEAQGLAVLKSLGTVRRVSIEDAHSYLASRNIVVAANVVADKRWQTLQIARLMQDQEEVLFAEPNWKRYPLMVNPASGNPLYSQQWHYGQINLEQAWQALASNNAANEHGSSDVIVAVLDSGIIEHDDLEANRVAGYDFVGANDSDPTDPGDKSIGNGQRSSFHGTHVAGTVAALSNNIGGTGVAPGVKIMPVRVLGPESGLVSDILEGICYAAKITDSQCSNVVNNSAAADVINLSLGSGGFSNIEERVYNKAMDQGVIVIAAAGNSSTSAPFYPAAYERVISVSAVNREVELASYSNFGSTIDVAAPGGDYRVDSGVLSTVGDDSGVNLIDTYGRSQGTSMASPHVAGVAALMKSAANELTHNDFRNLLNSGALTQDIGPAGNDNSFGMGLIDAQKAVLAALNSNGPRIHSTTSSLYFGVGQVGKIFTISDNGDDIGNISVSDDADWLTLNKSSGLGDYTATVNSSGLFDGSYKGIITISSDNVAITDFVIQVELQVGNPELTPNAGVQYVLVIDKNAQANSEGVLKAIGSSVALLVNQGEYQYTVEGLPKGEFYIVTGSDLDLDLVICDDGESCGQYPTLNAREEVEISEETSTAQANMAVNYIETSGQASVKEDSRIFQYSRVIERTSANDEGTEDAAENDEVESLKSFQLQN